MLLVVEASISKWGNVETGSPRGGYELFRPEKRVAWIGASSEGGEESVGAVGTGRLWASILSTDSHCN